MVGLHSSSGELVGLAHRTTSTGIHMGASSAVRPEQGRR